MMLPVIQILRGRRGMSRLGGPKWNAAAGFGSIEPCVPGRVAVEQNVRLSLSVARLAPRGFHDNAASAIIVGLVFCRAKGSGVTSRVVMCRSVLQGDPATAGVTRD